MDKLIIVISFLISLVNCSSTTNNNEKRVELIKTALGFIERGNIDSLKTIVDTSYFYKLYGEDGFGETVARTRPKIVICKAPNSGQYKINDPVPQLTEYTLQFCRTATDSLTDKSFDLVFTFLNNQNMDLIALIDFRDYSYRNKRNEPPPGL